MKYYTIAPPPSLSEYVRFFWVLEGNEAYAHRSMADGCTEMIFHYNGVFDAYNGTGASSRSALTGLAGPSQQYHQFKTNTGFGIFGVYLYPFAIPYLFSIAAADLSDQLPDLPAIFGKEGRQLEEQVLMAASNKQRVSIVTSFLEKKLYSARRTNTAMMATIRYIIHAKTFVKVESLAKNSFLSTRQFERNFKTLTGFTPKLFSRIMRFQAAMQCSGHDFPSLTSIAYNCGYYDQSHFIHDFKKFSGYHPKQYFSGNAHGVEWRNFSD